MLVKMSLIPYMIFDWFLILGFKVIGTSGTVAPASNIPWTANSSGAKIVEVS